MRCHKQDLKYVGVDKKMAVSDVCRLCLSDEKLIWVFDKSLVYPENMKDVIVATTGVEILERDIISQKICKNCHELTVTMFKFRQVAVKADKYLKEKCKELLTSSDVAIKIPNTSVSIKTERRPVIPTTDNHTDPKITIKPVTPKMKTPLKVITSPQDSKRSPTISSTCRRKVHPTIDKLFSTYADIKLPSSCLKVDVSPFVCMEMDAVEEYFRHKNMDMMEAVRIYSRAPRKSSPENTRTTQDEESSKEKAATSGAVVGTDEEVVETAEEHVGMAEGAVGNAEEVVGTAEEIVGVAGEAVGVAGKAVGAIVEVVGASGEVVGNSGEVVDASKDQGTKVCPISIVLTKDQLRVETKNVKRKIDDDEDYVIQQINRKSRRRRISSSDFPTESEPTLWDSLKLKPVEVHRCHHCSFELPDRLSLKKHIHQHYKCDYCKVRIKAVERKPGHIRTCKVKHALSTRPYVKLERVDHILKRLGIDVVSNGDTDEEMDVGLQKTDARGEMDAVLPIRNIGIGGEGDATDKIERKNRQSVTMEKVVVNNEGEMDSLLPRENILGGGDAMDERTEESEKNHQSASATMNNVGRKRDAVLSKENILGGGGVMNESESATMGEDISVDGNKNVPIPDEVIELSDDDEEEKPTAVVAPSTAQFPAENSQPVQYLSSGIVKPAIKIKDNSLLDFIDTSVTDVRVLKEILKQTRPLDLKLSVEGVTQTDLPVDENIVKNANTVELRGLLPHLYSYEVPVEIKKGGFNVSYGERKVPEVRVIKFWNNKQMVDVKAPKGTHFNTNEFNRRLSTGSSLIKPNKTKDFANKSRLPSLNGGSYFSDVLSILNHQHKPTNQNTDPQNIIPQTTLAQNVPLSVAQGQNVNYSAPTNINQRVVQAMNHSASRNANQRVAHAVNQSAPRNVNQKAAHVAKQNVPLNMNQNQNSARIVNQSAPQNVNQKVARVPNQNDAHNMYQRKIVQTSNQNLIQIVPKPCSDQPLKQNVNPTLGQHFALSGPQILNTMMPRRPNFSRANAYYAPSLQPATHLLVNTVPQPTISSSTNPYTSVITASSTAVSNSISANKMLSDLLDGSYPPNVVVNNSEKDFGSTITGATRPQQNTDLSITAVPNMTSPNYMLSDFLNIQENPSDVGTSTAGGTASRPLIRVKNLSELK